MKIILYFIVASYCYASMYSAIAGPHFTTKSYENKDRGIIINQDIDGDGIDDINDNCLDKTKCSNSTGCNDNLQDDYNQSIAINLDIDGDGISNTNDKCPNSLKDYIVNDDGCTIYMVLEIDLGNKKTSLNDSEKKEIDKLIKFMNEHPNYYAQIKYYVDEKTTSAYTKESYELKTKAIEDYLIEINNTDITKININNYDYNKLLFKNEPMNISFTNKFFVTFTNRLIQNDPKVGK